MREIAHFSPILHMLSDAQKRQLCRRYPEWKAQIEQGDFRIEVSGGEKSVVWPNTAIFAPTFVDINTVISGEFQSVAHRLIKFKVGIISLVITGPSKTFD